VTTNVPRVEPGFSMARSRPRPPVATRGWLLAAWLIASVPAARPIASAAPLPNPVFGPPSLNPFGLSDVGNAATPSFADLDGDGDFDALYGNKSGDLIFFRNSGNATSPAFGSPSTNPFGLANIGTTYAKATFVDLDGDGDLDVVVGTAQGTEKFFRNTGSPTSPAFAAASVGPFGLTTVSYDAAPCFADLDGDGDLDALVGEFGGDVRFFRNSGAASSPAFAGSSVDPFGLTGVGVSEHSQPAMVDLEGDGDLDVVTGTASGYLWFFRNTGTHVSPAFAAPRLNAFGTLSVHIREAPAFVDIDGDGDLDLFIGDYNGDTVLFPNLTDGLLFEDDFESGDTSNWSSHGP